MTTMYYIVSNTAAVLYLLTGSCATEAEECVNTAKVVCLEKAYSKDFFSMLYPIWVAVSSKMPQCYNPDALDPCVSGLCLYIVSKTHAMPQFSVFNGHVSKCSLTSTTNVFSHHKAISLIRSPVQGSAANYVMNEI